MTEVSFTVPGPCVSTNATYRRGRGRRLYKSDEAKDFAQRIQYAARRSMRGRLPFAGFVRIDLAFFFASDRSDIDGSIKPILDAMEGFVYANDRAVRLLGVEKHVEPERPRLEVWVREIMR